LSANWRQDEGGPQRNQDGSEFGRPAENARGQNGQCPEEFEDATYGDADKAKWQEYEPKKWVEDQGEKSQRPAEEKKNAP
jgi:hypothetical protein